MKYPVYSDGIGRELVFPGACMTKTQAMAYGNKRIPVDLKRAGFKTFVFESDLVIHGAKYLRVTYGKDC